MSKIKALVILSFNYQNIKIKLSLWQFWFYLTFFFKIRNAYNFLSSDIYSYLFRLKTLSLPHLKFFNTKKRELFALFK